MEAAELHANEMGCSTITYYNTTFHKRITRKECDKYPENYPGAQTEFTPGVNCPPQGVAMLAEAEQPECCEISYLGDTFHKHTTLSECLRIPENYTGATVVFNEGGLCPPNIKPASEMD